MSESGMARRPSLAALSVYPAITPYNGGSSRIFNLAKAYAEFFDVTYFSQWFSPEALGSCSRRTGGPHYTEWVTLDPISAVSFGISRFLRSPELTLGVALRVAAPANVRRAFAEAEIGMVDQPWLFAWARAHRPRRPLVYSAQNVEATMFDPQRFRLPARLKQRVIAEIDRQERAAVQGADLVIATSEDDVATFMRRYDVRRERFRVAPNGVDCTKVRPPTAVERESARRRLGLADKRILVFVGAKHPANVEAVRTLLALADAERNERRHFLVAGSVGALFSNIVRPNVTFTGVVSEVRPYLAAADVALNPIVSGGGTNIKQIEYMATGLPSITTPFGARGLGIVNGHTALVREVVDFLSADQYLDDCADASARMSQSARQFALDRYEWSRIGHMAAMWLLSLQKQ